MTTPAHAVINLLGLARKKASYRQGALIAGAIAPDAPIGLYIVAFRVILPTLLHPCVQFARRGIIAFQRGRNRPEVFRTDSSRCGLTREEVIIGNKVFVGNLNFDTNQGELEALFSEVGELVEVFLPSDRTTGRPRGFAFVEFTDPASIPVAVERFDGYELGGRNLRVNQAEDRPPRRPSHPSGGGGERSFERPWGGPRGGAKPKGSRRNLRRGKRSL